VTDSHSPQPRYAVYYAPPRSSALWQLAQSWLGRDCESGETLAPPALDGVSAEDVEAATSSPRHYGFHATLKAPFRLAPGASLRRLHDSLGAFAAGRQPFQAPPLKVSAIGPFLALTLSTPSPEMESLAAAAVQDLDDLRAPLSEAELQRRLAGGLSPRQQELLRAWGYPYVLDEFRFHMTLTGPIADQGLREMLQTKLAALFRPLLADPVPVGEICLYSQDSAEIPFTLVDRFRFGAASSASVGGSADSVEGPAIS
jgi:putative phosphonate metabolism protein